MAKTHSLSRPKQQICTVLIPTCLSEGFTPNCCAKFVLKIFKTHP